MSSKVEIIDVGKDCNEIDIFEVSEFRSDPTFFAVVPSQYNCEIVFSPKVLQAMLQWLIQNNYVILDGTLTIPVRNIKRVYRG
jgi:hypothetical protein